MATYNTTNEDYSMATFDDVLVNAYGDKARIIDETPNGKAWIVQSLKYDNVRRVMFKDSANRR